MEVKFKSLGRREFFLLLTVATLVAILAFTNKGAFSLGFLSADFSTDRETLESNNQELNNLVNKLESNLLALRSQNEILKKQLSDSQLAPLSEFETLINSFLEKYGAMKTSTVDISCENDVTKNYRRMKRELAILKAKAIELDLEKTYHSFFSSFQGMTIHGIC